MEMPRSLLLSALCLPLAVACGSDAQPTEPDPHPSGPLPAGVYELRGVSATLPYDDLEPFRALVGSTPYVALGESTHRSRGYYEMKARLVRYMVEDLGFRVLAFETPWLEALPASRYVASCTGTPGAALGSMLPVWHDASVRNMLTWLCEYNRQHPSDPVTFFGFDIQEPWKSAPALRQFVRTTAPDDVAMSDPLFRCLGASDENSRAFHLSQAYRDLVEGRGDAEAHDQCIGGITALESWISSNESALTSATSPVAVEEARLALVALRAWEDQLWVPDPGGYQARDFGMSQLVRRLHALHTPGRKTMIWAWNWHIARRYEEVRGFDDDPQAHVPRQGARAMGSFLHDAWGADYLPIALIGYRVEMSGGITLPQPTGPLAVEKRLHDLGRDYLLVDLRQPLPDTLLPSGRSWQVSQEWGDPYRQFGALIYIDHSPAMVHVPVQ